MLDITNVPENNATPSFFEEVWIILKSKVYVVCVLGYAGWTFTTQGFATYVYFQN